MAANFRTRPLLMAAAARPAIFHNAFASRGLVANMEQTRQYAASRRRIDPRFRNSMAYVKKNQSKQEATSSVMSNLMSEEKNHYAQGEMAMMAPRTIVPLPFSKAPSGLSNFCRYYFEVAKQRFADRLQILQATMALKNRFWDRAKFKPSRKGVPEAALALHATMSENLAAGTPEAKKTLSRVCAPKLLRSLVSAIEMRPNGKRYRWERLAVTGKPRLVDHKWTDSNTSDSPMTISFRQAVVRIASKQRLTELNAKGEEVGSKEMDLVEYVVLWRRVDKARLKEEDWLIYGTLKETTLEELDEELELMKELGNKRATEKLVARQRELEASK